MHPIALLDPHLINQISAGEVVERPASVLKELLENAVDSGASRIIVRWRQGGQSLLEVEDNGCGIPKNQIRLALARHATSKLRTQEDLHAIKTFGFRGEALSAVSAVSRLSLTTRHADEDHAWSISVHGGQEIEFLPSNREKGTAVHVRDLFFATPARLKFLRSITVEQQHLWDVVHKAMLAHPDIAFSIHSDTRVVEYPTGMIQRLKNIWGKGFEENAFYVDTDRSAYRLTGWIGLPTYHRAMADRQFFFVNDRTVKDKILASALRAAFGDSMPKGRHPVGVLFLSVPFADLDANVHPAKTEIRFLDPRFVRSFVVGIIKEAVWKHGLRASTWSARSHDALDLGSRDGDEEMLGQHSAETKPVFMDCTQGASGIGKPMSSLSELQDDWPAYKGPTQDQTHDQTQGPIHHSTHRPYHGSVGAGAIYDPTIARESPYFVPNQGSAVTKPFMVTHRDICQNGERYTAPEIGSKIQPSLVHNAGPDIRPDAELHFGSVSEAIFVDLGQAIMQIQDTYIVARNAAGLVLVDPHAAHERIVYERMKTQWDDGVGAVQMLLMPSVWGVTDTEYDHMESIQGVMETLGFAYSLSDDLSEKTPWGNDVKKTCTLKSIPSIFQAYDPESLFRDLLSCVQQGDLVEDILLSWRNHMMANWACRQSLKLGQTLSLSAMNALLRTLERTPHGAQCNHGRCVYRILTPKDLARMFDR